MTALIASILSVALPSILNWIEAKRGPKTGPQKMEDAFAVALSLLQTLGAQGIGPKEINDPAVKAMIEMLLAKMKTDGTFQDASAPAKGEALVTGGQYPVTLTFLSK